MKWSFTGVALIVLGITGIAIILLFQQITTSNENDYYLLKEITEASMIESIDIKYYRETGDLRIVKEKFVENFTRRYSESTLFIGTKYTISFFDIMEVPPKVTIMIDTGLEQYRIYNDTSNYNVVNNLTGILEFTGKESINDNGGKEIYKKETYTQQVYSMPGIKNGEINIREAINIPKEINDANMRNQKVIAVSEPVVVTEQGDLLKAKLRREIDWASASTNKTDYSKNNDIKSYSDSFTLEGIYYYNCADRTSNNSEKANEVKCKDYNLPWIIIDGFNNENKNVALKYNVTWSYEKYKYEYDKEEFK